MRHEYARFYIAARTVEHLTELSDNARGTIRFSTHSRSKSFLAVVHEMQNGKSIWSDPTTPAFLRGKDDKDINIGVFFRTDCHSATLEAVKTTGDLVNILKLTGYESRISLDGNALKFGGGGTAPFGILILDRDGSPHFLYQLDDGNTVTTARIQSNSSRETKRTRQS